MGLLVAIIIGMALLAFVIGDLLNQGRSMFSKSQYEIAKVAGKSIPYTEFDQRVNSFVEINKIQTGQTSLDESTIDNIRDVSWDYMIEEFIMSDEYKKLGIAVTGDELMDMIQGENPHPIIRQVFSDPQTGRLNRSFMFDFIQRTLQEETSERKTFWLYIENEIFRQRRLAKFNNLIRQGLYVTSLQSDRKAQESSKKMDIDFILQRFSLIPDSLISINSNEIKNYYNEHLENYRQEASRDIKFVTFEVIPSEEDFMAAENWINSIKPEFEATDETKQFVNLQSDVPYDSRNYTKDELPETIADYMFNATVGDIYGPYFENNAYKLAKLAKIDYLPDSVKARHILLQATQENSAQVIQFADSLKEMIEKGADFAELARQYSSDGSAQEGGDLGWFEEGDMVRSFSDSCFYGKPGDIKLVGSQFGLHIIEILAQSEDVKKVQVGTLVRNVEPGPETDQGYYIRASEFAGVNNTYEKFNQAIESHNLIPRTAPGLKPLDKEITGLESPRLLVKWAYNADEHDVSNVMKFGNKYVVATVEDVKEKGYADIEDVKFEIQLELTKQLKAEKLIEEINAKSGDAENMEALARSLKTEILNAASVNFVSRSITNIGIEPRIPAAAFALETDEVSDPIIGNNGVYVITVTAADKPENLEFVAEREKMAYERSYTSQANYASFEALKRKAEIVDNRAEFF
ncbi:MAG: SurA N-terminal domain-containing protein [Bacteroidales bacterium]|nr:SurA N-terminal domain-containing protein [Bacteroidales bacterium]